MGGVTQRQQVGNIPGKGTYVLIRTMAWFQVAVSVARYAGGGFWSRKLTFNQRPEGFQQRYQMKLLFLQGNVEIVWRWGETRGGEAVT